MILFILRFFKGVTKENMKTIPYLSPNNPCGCIRETHSNFQEQVKS